MFRVDDDDFSPLLSVTSRWWCPPPHPPHPPAPPSACLSVHQVDHQPVRVICSGLLLGFCTVTVDVSIYVSWECVASAAVPQAACQMSLISSVCLSVMYLVPLLAVPSVYCVSAVMPRAKLVVKPLPGYATCVQYVHYVYFGRWATIICLTWLLLWIDFTSLYQNVCVLLVWLVPV